MYCLPVLALGLSVGPTLASPLARSAHAPLAVTEVERPLILGRGWLELDLGAEVKSTTGYWGAEGEKVTFVDENGEGGRWLYTTERLGVRYGLTRHAEVYAEIPVHYVRWTSLDIDYRAPGLAGPRVGGKVEWFRKHAPTVSIVTDAYVRLPVGTESAGSTVGWPNAVSGLPLTTGTMETGIDLAGKQQFGPLALTASVGYVHRFSSVALYRIEVQGENMADRFKPGDEVRLALEPVVQLGPLALSARFLYVQRAVAAVGASSAGLVPDHDLKPIGDSDGWSLEVTPGLTVNVSRGLDLQAALGIPVRGEDVVFFPFEELTPTRGLTWAGGVEVRY